MQTRYVLTTLLLTTLALCGCGSNSHDPVPTPYRTISGQVIDGPIEGAYVYLYQDGVNSPLSICGASRKDLCRSRATDSEGSFSFTIDSSYDLNNLYLKTWKGKDTDTARDFTNIPLEFPLGRLLNATEPLTISPLTTLVNALRRDGYRLSEAIAFAADSLNLTESELFQDPRSSLTTLRLTQILSATAQRLVEESGSTVPLRLIAQYLPSEKLVSPTEYNVAVIAEIPSLAQKDIERLYYNLQNSSSPEYTIQINALATALTQGLRESIPTSDTYNSATFVSAAEAIAATLLAANGYQPVPLGGILPTRLAYYVAATYNTGAIDLSSPSGYNSTLPGFSALLDELANDSLISSLAEINSKYAVEAPLSTLALLGNDNSKRIEYYLNSDRSFLHEGIDAVQGVNDASINDAVFLAEVTVLANHGLFAHALKICAENILSIEIKAHAYLEIGVEYIEHGNIDSGITYLARSENLFKSVISAIGPENIDQKDALNLYRIQRGYQEAGDLDAAQGINLYLESIAQISNNATVYGRIITGAVGIEGIFESYVTEGDTNSASALALWGYNLATLTPAYQGHFMLRVSNLSVVLRRFAELQDQGNVSLVYNSILTQIADTTTKTKSSVYFDDIAEGLVAVDMLNEARDIANLASTISAKEDALEFVATRLAVTNSYNAALAEIQGLSEIKKQIEGLTYKNSSTNNAIEYSPRVAAALFLDGNLADATSATYNALSKVDTLLAADPSANAAYTIQYGYTKVAKLFQTLGEGAAFYYSMQQAEITAESLTSNFQIQQAFADQIASEYFEAGEKVLCENSILHALNTFRLHLDDPYWDSYAYRAALARGREFGLNHVIAPYLEEALSITRNISTPYSTQTEISHETARLSALAESTYHLDSPEAANALLAEALTMAAGLFSEKDRTSKIKDIAQKYAELGFFADAIEATSHLTYLNDRNTALLSIAENLQSRDSFPDTWVADIDTDGDGMPNFFHPLATQADIEESGLILDDDTDNDGIPDTLDRRPLYPDI